MRSEHIFATASQFLLEDNQVIMGCRGIMGTASPHLACALAVLRDGILPSVYGMHLKLENRSCCWRRVSLCPRVMKEEDDLAAYLML